MPTTQINIQTRADLAALNLTAKSFNVLSAQEQAAEKQTLALAQQMARLDAAMKQPASGALRLKAALESATYIDPTQGIQALSQITQLEKQATVEADKLAKATRGLGTNNGLQVLPRTLAGLSGEALTAAKSFLLLKVAHEGLDFIKTGAEVADVTKSFNNLAVAAGTTGEALLTSLRASSNNTITDASLIKNANLGLLLTQGQIAKSLPQLTQIAQASAKATGQSVDFIFESLVRGISRGSAKIIDNAGITLDGEAAYNDYAASIGKTADQLTKAEQQQAVTNAVLKTGAQIVKDVGINADDSSVKIAQAQTAIENLGTAIGAKIAPFAGQVAGGIANVLSTGNVTPDTESAGTQVQGGLIRQSADFEAYAKSVRDANQSITDAFAGDPVAGALALRLHGLQQLNPVEFAYAQSLIQTGTAYQSAIAQAQALGAVSDSLTQQTQGQSAAIQALVPSMAQAASGSQENASQVLALNSAYLQGQISADVLKLGLEGIIRAHDQAAQAAFQEERETRNLARSFDTIVPSIKASADALSEEQQEKLANTIETAGLAQQQKQLESDSYAAAQGIFAAGDQAVALAQKYGIATEQAQFLINAQQHLSNATALADQRKGEQTGTTNTAAEFNRFSDLARVGANERAAEAKKIADKAAKDAAALADVQFDNSLKKTKTNAAKIALLRQKEATTSDPVEKARIEGQIIDLQNQKVTGLHKEANLQESIYDSINKQKDALLDIEELTIKDRQADRDAAAKNKSAQAIIKATEGKTDARSLDFRARAQDVIALNSVEDRQRAAAIAEKQATAGGTLSKTGKILQSKPGAGTAPPKGTPAGAAPSAGASAPVNTPQAAAAPAGGATLTINLVADGKNLASVTEPYIMDALMAAVQTAKARAGA